MFLCLIRIIPLVAALFLEPMGSQPKTSISTLERLVVMGVFVSGGLSFLSATTSAGRDPQSHSSRILHYIMSQSFDQCKFGGSYKTQKNNRCCELYLYTAVVINTS